MNKLKIIFPLLIFLSACNKDEPVLPDHTQIFTNEHFRQYEDYFLSVVDAELQADESMILVGNGGEDVPLIRTPFFLKIGTDNELSEIKFLEFDNRQIYRDIDLLATQDGNFIYLSHSKIDEFSTDTDIDVRKLDESGETEWKEKIGELSKQERGVSTTQLPNGDYILLGYNAQDFPQGDEYLLVRITAEGEMIWSKEISDDNILSLREILYLPGDHSILVLSEYGLGLAAGDIKLTKLDVEGNVIATKLLLENKAYFSHTSFMKILDDGSILVCFSSREEGTSNDLEIKMVKLNDDLTEVWERNYGQVSSDIVSDVILTAEGDYLILSKSSGIGRGEFDVILTKTDSEGEVLWRNVFGSTSSDQGHRIFEKSNKNILIIGNSNHNTGSDAIFNLFLLETDAEGNPV